MVNLNELWIGDKVLLLKSNRKGTYEGSSQGKARVKVNDRIVLTPPSNLRLLPDDTVLSPSVIIEKEEPSAPYSPPSNEIDLHIESLNPSLQNSRAEHILDYQIKAAKSFIEKAIDSRLYQIKLVHGKGEGVLKSEVHHLLTLYDNVQYYLPENDGGATVVMLQYG